MLPVTHQCAALISPSPVFFHPRASPHSLPAYPAPSTPPLEEPSTGHPNPSSARESCWLSGGAGVGPLGSWFPADSLAGLTARFVGQPQGWMLIDGFTRVNEGRSSLPLLGCNIKKQTKWDLEITVSCKLAPVFHIKWDVKVLLWCWGEEKQISFVSLHPRVRWQFMRA